LEIYHFLEEKIIIGFDNERVAQKMLSMGFMVGNKITILRKAPFSKVFYVKIDGINIALRNNELAAVKVA
jgi:Fe2+ transport system protein FeoA